MVNACPESRYLALIRYLHMLCWANRIASLRFILNIDSRPSIEGSCPLFRFQIYHKHITPWYFLCLRGWFLIAKPFSNYHVSPKLQLLIKKVRHAVPASIANDKLSTGSSVVYHAAVNACDCVEILKAIYNFPSVNSKISTYSKIDNSGKDLSKLPFRVQQLNFKIPVSISGFIS